jgi:hypothetical protein
MREETGPMKRRILAVLCPALLAFLLASAGASAARPALLGRAQDMRTPHFRSCIPKEPALATVASLHRVSFRTACRITEKLVSYPWPESDMTHEGRWCFNWLGKVRQFEGWNLKVPKLNQGPATLSRGKRWFAFLGQEFPIGCV